MNLNDFIKIELEFEKNLFNELSNQIDFENVGRGRLGNHLVKISDKGIPIVRTTTEYNIPAHHFSSTHNVIATKINDKLKNLGPLNFNNALIEIYDSSYKKMKYHSDQCLDLATNSYIGLYSCYENPNELTEQYIRKLKIKNKKSDRESEITLTHNSAIVFSRLTNALFFHKIILDQTQKPLSVENRWLGITFRTSKTFIQFINGIPYFPDGTTLKLANDTQKREYFILRGEENRHIDFNYPKINYTLSRADTLLPKE